jgi:hypothetical protein
MTSHFRSLEVMYHGAPINTFFGPRITVSEYSRAASLKKERAPKGSPRGFLASA